MRQQPGPPLVSLRTRAIVTDIRHRAETLLRAADEVLSLVDAGYLTTAPAPHADARATAACNALQAAAGKLRAALLPPDPNHHQGLMDAYELTEHLARHTDICSAR